MIHELRIRRELRSSLETMLDWLSYSLKSEGFVILAKMDVTPTAPELPEPKSPDEFRTVVLRLLFDEERSLLHLPESRSSQIVRCTAILQEKEDGWLTVELSKPVRLLDSHNSKVARRARHADEALLRVASQLEAATEPVPPLSGGVSVQLG